MQTSQLSGIGQRLSVVRCENDSAVSPVIGSILMVAITVILAAVIAAFVFGMAGNIEVSRMIGITAERTGNMSVSLLNHGGAGERGLDALNVTVSGGSVYTFPASVGVPFLVAAPNPGKDQVVVTGVWSDGYRQILYARTM
ncbi:MAG: type IV pilin N-terminal domain-containing protein [Methanoregulaceae archaeon]|nr:type IV pilin N-terminal domain-containing protein [Methanoregulaceae archaeon]